MTVGRSCPSLGTWVKIAAPEVVELLATAGMDFVVIDNEHGSVDARTASTMISVAHGCGLRAFVRVAGHAPRDVRPALDAGADGLVVPQIDGVEDARRVVAACRFPPHGTRGGSPTTRAAGWGRLPHDDYLAHGNDIVTIVAQLETPRAAAEATAIVGVPGVDAVLVGPFDLAVTSGLRPDSAAARALVRQTEQRCTEAGAVLGGIARDGTEAAALLARGHRLVVIGSDIGFLAGGACAATDIARGHRNPIGAQATTVLGGGLP